MVDVGRLRDTGHHFTFAYTREAQAHPTFEPFPGLDSLDEVYRSETLFTFFADRAALAVGSAKDAAARLGLAPHRVEPVELLARSWGTSPHHTTIQVVPEPVTDDNGHWTLLFLASGVRHVDADAPEQRETALAGLSPGDLLALQPEPDNEFDPNAVLLVAGDQPIGYVPRYLTELVHANPRATATVEHVNGPEIASHLRLLCRLTA